MHKPKTTKKPLINLTTANLATIKGGNPEWESITLTPGNVKRVR
jgi:hypothetical protein